MQLLRRAMAHLTYCSLCPPDDLADRGLLGLPSALYAHDALRLWEIIARWVRVGAEKWRGIGEREALAGGQHVAKEHETRSRRGAEDSILGGMTKSEDSVSRV